jgi:hypothetical protein
MRAEMLARVGTALYGPKWQTDLAADLGVNDRTMRYWATGQRAIPDRIASELLALVTARGAELAAVAAELED